MSSVTDTQDSETPGQVPPVVPVPLSCPMCGLSPVGGLMSAFWVPLMADGMTPDGDWNEWSSETELSNKRMCYYCDHEFEI